MDEGRTEGAQQGEFQRQYVTVGEAAKLLGVHRNTVHHRIKAGRIIAHKVVEGERQVYRIERDSLGVGRTSADVHTLDVQRPTTGEELGRMIAARLDEIVRDYTEQLGTVREELGAERVRRQMAESTLREGMAEERRRREQAEQERDNLRRELEAIRAPRGSSESPGPTDAPTPDPGDAQAATEGRQGQESARRPWWRRLFGG